MLLSRVANSMYWMSRYIERAENLARFIEVNLNLTLDRLSGTDEQWMPVVNIMGDDAAFQKRYDKPTRANVTHFLTSDLDYPNSIASSIAAARENARTIRETITSEMWQQINALHIMMQSPSGQSEDDERLHEFYGRVRLGGQLFAAVTDATMSHNTAWDFCQLGRSLERADKASRLLDVKYYLLLPRVSDVGGALDTVQWSALLRSAGALEMYRQAHGTITPDNVANFLLLDQHFPRSMCHCLLSAEQALARIIGPSPRVSDLAVRRSLGQVRGELEFGEIQEIISLGLHEYLDQFQAKLNNVDAAMNKSLFYIDPPDPPQLQFTSSSTQSSG